MGAHAPPRVAGKFPASWPDACQDLGVLQGNTSPGAAIPLSVREGGHARDFDSQCDWQQSPDRADRSVCGIRPALTGTGWKRTSVPVQGWGAVQM